LVNTGSAAGLFFKRMPLKWWGNFLNIFDLGVANVQILHCRSKQKFSAGRGKNVT
jgi:hypothetical protein